MLRRWLISYRLQLSLSLYDAALSFTSRWSDVRVLLEQTEKHLTRGIKADCAQNSRCSWVSVSWKSDITWRLFIPLSYHFTGRKWDSSSEQWRRNNRWWYLLRGHMGGESNRQTNSLVPHIKFKYVKLAGNRGCNKDRGSISEPWGTSHRTRSETPLHSFQSLVLLTYLTFSPWVWHVRYPTKLRLFHVKINQNG